MTDTKTQPLTLKYTNERIDNLEERILSMEEKENEEWGENFSSLKKSLSSIRIYVIAISIVFIVLSIASMIPEKGQVENKDPWALFTTSSFPEWLSIERNDDSILLLIDGTTEKIMIPGDEYMVLSHKARLKVTKEKDSSLLLYGNGILYGGFKYQE
ncbi:MAG: hypothetical protein ACI4SL_10225 [Candidatus Ornithospirochaeta sp.]